MTQFSDILYQGRATFGKAMAWNGNANAGQPSATAPNDTQDKGVPHTPTFFYQLGTASTALASGLFYSASGSATTGSATLTGTGALVTASVGTFDVPRGVRITASVNLSTTTFQIVGTDGYGQTQTHQFVGPTGNTFGNTGSYTDSLVTFKTITAMTIANPTASGIATTALAIGSNDMYGLPFVLANKGNALGVWIDGSTASIAPTFVAAYTPTGTPTASTPDVRGSCTLATAVLANGSRYITIGMIQNTVNLTPNTDVKVNSFGAAPYGS